MKCKCIAYFGCGQTGKKMCIQHIVQDRINMNELLMHQPPWYISTMIYHINGENSIILNSSFNTIKVVINFRHLQMN